MSRQPHRCDRAGLALIEVVIVAVILAVAVLCVMLMAPRRREESRDLSCRINLAGIGRAAAQYDQSVGALPTMTADLARPPRDSGPLAAMARVVGTSEIGRPGPARPKGAALRGEVWTGGRVPGWVCPADRAAIERPFPVPVSYRAVTGDTEDGAGGPFGVGRGPSLAAIESSKGLAFTALFTERLVGPGQDGTPGPTAWVVVEGPVRLDATATTTTPDAWHGDAGSNATVADWVSTLINFAARPESAPILISLDRLSAVVPASSAHESGVHALMADGSARVVTNRVDPSVWRAMARLGDREVE
jgi:hypothetical protein